MMPKILLVSSDENNLEALAGALVLDPKVSLFWARSAGDALKIAGDEHPQLAVIDSALSGKNPLKLVAELISVDAMINTALVSAMGDKEFHETSEGLGIMARLPERPDDKDAARLLAALGGLVRE